MGKQVTWFEVIGKDGAKLRDFYSGIFDWKIDANNPMQYGLVQPEPGGIAGGIAGGSPQGPRVTFYVAVDDLHHALAKAESLGGKRLFGPDQVPGGPEIAMFADPDGNTFCVVEKPGGERPA